MSTNPPLPSLLRLDGRAAIVTGAAAGIGLQSVARLVECGAFVHAVDRSDESIDRARAELGDLDTSVRWHRVDVTDPDGAASVCDHAGDTLRVLVNNAGIYPQQPLLDAEPDLWDRIAAVNVRGLLNFLVPAARRMVALGGGSIVNLASVTGVGAAPTFAHYGATKAAVISLTRSSAVELGPSGVRVNAIAPGGIVTPGYRDAARRASAPQGGGGDEGDDSEPIAEGGPDAARPLRRLGTPDDVARAVLYFASDLSEYVTGVTLLVDGGVTLRRG